MKNTSDDKSLTKNAEIVYKLFKSCPFQRFDVYSILQTINEDKVVMSERTAYRIVEKLVKSGKIVCSDKIKGMRKYELSKGNHCILVCDSCGQKKLIELNACQNIYKKIYKKYDFDIERAEIEIRGICKETY
ncbi:MAG: transcriptional repressor [Bacillota bacterium]